MLIPDLLEPDNSMRHAHVSIAMANLYFQDYAVVAFNALQFGSVVNTLLLRPTPPSNNST
jgi:hypothetical protein